MSDSIEIILEVLFFILSIIWIGKILILRSDKQIVINPVLIGISSLLVILPNDSITLLGFEIQHIKIMLYAIYCMVVLFGIYTTNQKNGIF
ncbi:MAG: hypothetical protein RRZ84_03735 [Romboutsia sp.]